MAVGAAGEDARPAPAYADAPPPAHTGGFGEPTCRACHFDAELNESPGAVVLRGLPDAPERGPSPLGLTVVLHRPGTSRGGFQLSARYAEGPDAGAQAGGFEDVDGRVSVTTDGEVDYVHHGAESTRAEAPDTLRWELRWIPPDDPSGPVVFHVAANAANDDASEFGDHVYTDRAVLESGGRDDGRR